MGNDVVTRWRKRAGHYFFLKYNAFRERGNFKRTGGFNIRLARVVNVGKEAVRARVGRLANGILRVLSLVRVVLGLQVALGRCRNGF